MHLYLSPHADDAALSCGGHISQLTRQGQEVVIFTVMGGSPPPEFTPNDFTNENHTRWALGPDPVEGRRQEDAQAAAALGAQIKFGPYPDAIYRVHPRTNKNLYTDRDAIFGMVHPEDPVLQTRRAAVVKAITAAFDLHDTDTVHVPLGVGHHVDHQLVRDMGKAMIRWHPNINFYFYEEFPYVRQGERVIQATYTSLDIPAMRVTNLLDPVSLDAKIAAIRCYRSQLSGLDWDTTEAMAREVRTFFASTGGEREWHVLYVTDSPIV